VVENEVDVTTRDGLMSTVICHPDGNGPWPVIVLFMDARGTRPELRDMASRLATVGYYVALPDLYYRKARNYSMAVELVDGSDADRAPMIALLHSIDNTKIANDTEDLIRFIEQDVTAAKAPYGCVGYCMSGPFVFNAAATFPDRFAAAASIYGTPLMKDAPDAPHLKAARIKAELYFLCAELDKFVPMSEVEALDRCLKAAGVNYTIEVFPRVEHGFAFPERHCYDRASAERHWERLFDLFGRTLKA
jgi:carboxymethylenebutenolidase